MSLLSTMKQLVVAPGPRERTIRAGPLRGIKMSLDLSCQTQKWLGFYEREIFSELTAHSKGIRTALDIGVGYGDYTLYFLLRTQAERVIACENSAEMLSYLSQNLRLNGIEDSPRLEVVEKIIDSYVDKNHLTLDELASSLKPPILVKMDVDTDETKVLCGASEFLRLPDVRWIVETHSKALEKECLSIFQRAGYRTKVIRNARWRVFIPDLRPSEQNRWLSAIRP
jgi:16S rRNA G1207 methylase RsmC